MTDNTNSIVIKSAENVTLARMMREIGSHSFRKGISTFLSSVCSGPSVIAIYLRAGWSLGKMIYFNL